MFEIRREEVSGCELMPGFPSEESYRFDPLFLRYQREYASSAGTAFEVVSVRGSGKQIGAAKFEMSRPKIDTATSNTPSVSVELSAALANFPPRFLAPLLRALDCFIREEVGARGASIFFQLPLSNLDLGHLVATHAIRPHGFHAELRIDLRQSGEFHLAKIRKKFRQNLQKLQAFGELEISNAAKDLVLLRDLHRQVSGRVTRTSATWLVQESALSAGKAFLVLVRDSNQHLVGALYVMHAGSEAVSFSAAYDRSVTQRGIPLGLWSEWAAMSHLRERIGVVSYTIGQASPADLTDQKLVGINRFKDGFVPEYALFVSASV